MTNDEKWSWWVGRDGESYTTECDTREEAEYFAREEYEGAYILEAVKRNIKLSGYFDADYFIENAKEAAYEEHGDPDGCYDTFVVSDDQVKSLQDAVRSAIDTWQDQNGLNFTGYKFSASRNHEWIAGADDGVSK